MEVLTHNLANNLAKLGNNVSVLVPRINCRFDDNVLNYKIIEFKYIIKPVDNIILVLNLFKTKFKEKFEILQACQTYPPGYCGAFLKKLMNVPLVVLAGGADIQKMPEINYGMRLNSKIEKKIRFGLKNSDAIVAISNSIKKDIIQAGNFKNKISKIPIGVNLERFNSKIENNILTKYKISPNNRIILAVGRYRIRKGFEYLLYAIKEVKKEVKDISCVIIGHGNKRLMNLIRKLELTRVVTIVDEKYARNNEILNFNEVLSDKIVSFYCSSDIYVSPSILEGFQITNIEALAAGLPLILTDSCQKNGWTTDYLKNNKNGFRISTHNINELKDKIITLLNDDKLRNSMGRESKKISKKFEWKEIAKRYLKLYKKLLADN